MKNEIEVWVTAMAVKDLENKYNGCTHVMAVPGQLYKIPARLIFDLPEKKIELTEKEFDEAWKDLTYGELDNPWCKRFEILKQKLFGEKR